MNILAIEPYFGGSHRAFLESVVRHSKHHWHLAILPARHWKWRMRSAPVALCDVIAATLSLEGQREDGRQETVSPDVVFCSDMLDLPTWLGFASRDSRLKSWIGQVPIITYFHENQWAYPVAAKSQADYHYAFTNLLTASLSDECWFNSNHNRETFLSHARDFLKRMPDSRAAFDLDAIDKRSCVVVPGFEAFEVDRQESLPGDPLRIGWVGRFESDKRPDRFVELLQQLESDGVDFQLVLLGERGRRDQEHARLIEVFSHRVFVDEYAGSVAEYHNRLSMIDVVVSTADHEFFGIAMCEAIWAGAVPVVPDGLSYPEYVPDQLRYETLSEAAQLIQSLQDPAVRNTQSATCRTRIENWTATKLTPHLDKKVSGTILFGTEVVVRD
ncbi:DUF3524 domain-containing protein [Rhodopirellula sp. MGV]|uniref:tRNA-queuosine alpha-mannosyltransferase domain-containing protein n=1 Tax=Rhodopirellula sp. MGV TaxID=2023130 RepID=UPI000B96B65A|nr:DUF3524 domain-containing protein [Rhodopirellula sp. MGV]OYP34531.1 hypothetical protein CGZ80_14130 [Rhodopirellula sp. MGV]PNY36753.1 DUF3524 domain-containing protein [Rhodopirellula baltica]